MILLDLYLLGGILILFMLWQVAVINWKANFNKRGEAWAKVWHSSGWIVRLLIHLIVFFSVRDYLSDYGGECRLANLWHIFAQAITFNFTYIYYDVFINVLRDKPISYIDDRAINGTLKRLIGSRGVNGLRAGLWILVPGFFISYLCGVGYGVVVTISITLGASGLLYGLRGAFRLYGLLPKRRSR